MINRKKYVNIHIELQWPLRFEHKCTKIITTVSKKIKYPPLLEISHNITKRFNTTKYYDREYRNLPTSKIHQKGKQTYTQISHYPRPTMLLIMPRLKLYHQKGRSRLLRNPIPRRMKPSLPKTFLHLRHPGRKRSRIA